MTKKDDVYHRKLSVKYITDKIYEKGRQDRCRKWIWRAIIHPTFFVCYRTYLNDLKDVEHISLTEPPKSIDTMRYLIDMLDGKR